MMKNLANCFAFLCFSSHLQLIHAGVLRGLETNAKLAIDCPVPENRGHAGFRPTRYVLSAQDENHIERLCASLLLRFVFLPLPAISLRKADHKDCKWADLSRMTCGSHNLPVRGRQCLVER